MSGIDFNTYEEFVLEDLADYERGKAGVMYPKGTSTLQISATRGQIGYLEKPGPVASKDVAIVPAAGIHPRYFNIVMQKNIGAFMARYATGINIQEKEVARFPIQLHNYETQAALVLMWEQVEHEMRSVEREIAIRKALKNTLMEKMFV